MSRPKPWRQGAKTWEKATHARTQEILREVLERGRKEQAKGRHLDRKRVMMFDVDDLLELFGPPPHGMPIVKDDLLDFFRRAAKLKLDGEAILS